MKDKFILILLCVSFIILIGLGYLLNQKNNRINSLEAQLTDQAKNSAVFDKKIECVKHKDDMLTFAQNYRSTIYELEEIFYSPNNETCYFIAKTEGGGRIIFDYLSQSRVIGKSSSTNCLEYIEKEDQDWCFETLSKSEIEYERKLRELKYGLVY